MASNLLKGPWIMRISDRGVWLRYQRLVGFVCGRFLHRSHGNLEHRFAVDRDDVCVKADKLDDRLQAVTRDVLSLASGERETVLCYAASDDALRERCAGDADHASPPITAGGARNRYPRMPASTIAFLHGSHAYVWPSMYMRPPRAAFPAAR